MTAHTRSQQIPDELGITHVVDDMTTGGWVGWVNPRKATEARLWLEREGYTVKISGRSGAVTDSASIRIKWWRA
jgi:hypothetical protein